MTAITKPGAWTDDRWQDYLTGYVAGYADGIATGREQADDEAATLHREAVRIVREMASLPARDADADREAAARRDVRWSA